MVRLIRPLLCFLLARFLNRPHCLTIVQNPEDQSLLEHSGIAGARLRLIRGAGVNTDQFYSVISPSEPVCIVLVARMLWDKGVGEFVEAAHCLTREGAVSFSFLLL